MAIKKCGNCGNEIINELLVCPACKEPVKKKGKFTLIIAFGLIVVTFGILGVLDSGTTSTVKSSSGYQFGENDQANHFMAYSVMEDFVKEKLKSPSTAKFPETFEKREHIKHKGNRTYHIDSWVDSENSYGAKIRARVVGDIQQTGEYDWKLISLKLL
jgi:hypothetical protein